MKSQQNTVTVVGPFQGRVSNVNPHIAPPGSSVSQINIGLFTTGQLDVRRGMNPSSFSNSTTASTNNIVAVTSFNRPEGRYVCYLLSDGTLKAGRNPS